MISTNDPSVNAQAALPLRPPAAYEGPKVSQGQQSQPLRFTLAAGETRQFQVQGSWFYVKELYGTPGATASDDITIATDTTGPIFYNVGTGFKFPLTTQFSMLQIVNPTAQDIFCEIVTGYGEYIDNRLNIVRVRPESVLPSIELPVEIDGWLGSPPGTYLIPALGEVTFTKSITGDRYAMKGFTVANADPNTAVRIKNADGDFIGRVIADTSQIFPYDGDFTVENPSGAAVEVYVGTLYWLNIP